MFVREELVSTANRTLLRPTVLAFKNNIFTCSGPCNRNYISIPRSLHEELLSAADRMPPGVFSERKLLISRKMR